MTDNPLPPHPDRPPEVDLLARERGITRAAAAQLLRARKAEADAQHGTREPDEGESDGD